MAEGEFQKLALAEGLTDVFPDAVVDEVRAFLASPGIDDPKLDDLGRIPFVTVDGPATRDLDQAVFVEARASGFRLFYAIADASYYVAPGTALFAEALRRGASFYLPGYSVPMLPRALSEDLVSLGPNAPRRALVFDVDLDERGGVRDFAIRRARVESRAKLAFSDVDALATPGATSRVLGTEAEPSMRALLAVGALRADHEDRSQMIRYRRVEAEARMQADGTVVVSSSPRGPAELANEQVSILCNALGAQFLAEAREDFVQPIYRIHAPPDPHRVEAFERLVALVAKGRDLPDDPWVYRRAAESGLSGYLERLPTEGAAGRLARALHRQAMLLNGRSTFSSEASAHHGVGESIYARFTAPMREMVGIFCHKEALERIAGRGARSRAEDEATRAQVIEAANLARDVQRKLNREVGRRVVRSVLGPDLAKSYAERPNRKATVMGISPTKLHILLDDPPIDAVVPLREQGQVMSGAWLECGDEGAKLMLKKGGAIVCRLGDEVTVRAVDEGAVVLVV